MLHHLRGAICGAFAALLVAAPISGQDLPARDTTLTIDAARVEDRLNTHPAVVITSGLLAFAAGRAAGALTEEHLRRCDAFSVEGSSIYDCRRSASRGALVGQTLAIPTIMHLVNRREGNWLAATAAAAGLGALGHTIGASKGKPEVGAMFAIPQVVVTYLIERRGNGGGR